MVRCLPIVLVLMQACIPGQLSPPPMDGYGAPYRGTGAPIFVKDSRTDWDITEGGNKLTSEQALEATGDPAYEARRQQLKRYNEKLYSQGKWHRRWGVLWELVGLGAIGAGAYYAYAPQSFGSMGSSTMTARYEGYGAALLGVVIFYYAMRRAGEPPPYVPWHTPSVYDRPAYVRLKTEAYNEQHGAPSTDEQPGSVERSSRASGKPGRSE